MSELNIGPTGEPPLPQSTEPADRGGLRAALSVDRAAGLIRCDFGTSLSFLLMTRAEAVAFAEHLHRLALRLSR